MTHESITLIKSQQSKSFSAGHQKDRIGEYIGSMAGQRDMCRFPRVTEVVTRSCSIVPLSTFDHATGQTHLTEEINVR